MQSLQDVALDSLDAAKFKRCAGLLMWFALRRVELQFASKEVARGMATPSELDMVRLRRAAKYLRDRPRGEYVFELRALPKCLDAEVDAD